MTLELYNFQKEGIWFLAEKRRAILGDEMGLGKTRQVIETCRKLQIWKILVVVPNALKTNFANEIRKWWPEAPIWISDGTFTERAKQLEAFRKGFCIINYEMLQNDRIVVTLLKGDWQALIFDEAHRLRNRKAIWTQAAKRLAKTVPCLYPLSGTPIMNRVGDFWPLLHLIDPERYSSYWTFVKRWANAHPGKFGWVVEDKTTDPEGFSREIAPYFLRREKSQVGLDLPPVTTQQIWLDMEDAQLRLYEQMLDSWMAEINPGEILTAPICLSWIMRLKQICVLPHTIGAANSTKAVKIEALGDIVFESQEKFVIFSQFAKVVEYVDTRWQDISVLHTGEKSGKERDKAIERFRNDPNCRLFCATIQSAGEGLNLTAAPNVVFLDKHWTPATNAQAAARVHRPGQAKPVTIVELLCRNSIEEWIEEILDAKGNLTAEVIDRIAAMHVNRR